MTDQDDKDAERKDKKLDEQADALRALAGGTEPTPTQAEQALQQSEADNIQDDADALSAIAGRGSAPGLGGDAFGAGPSADPTAAMEAAEELAAGDADEKAAAALAAADAGPVDLAAELAAQAAGRPDAASELAAAAGTAAGAARAAQAGAPAGAAAPAFPGAPAAASPEEKRARAAQFSMQTRRVHAYQFKKIAIPPLIVVALMLLIMGTVAVFLPGGVGVGETHRAPGVSVIDQYRPWLILSAFVVGPILLLGAWLFYSDVRRSDQEVAARKRQAAAKADDRP